MNTNTNKRNRPNPPGIKSLLDYFMAMVMVFFGCIILFPEEILGVNYFKDSALVQGAMKWVIGFLFILYGGFRAYRGYIASKNKRNDDDD